MGTLNEPGLLSSSSAPQTSSSLLVLPGEAPRGQRDLVRYNRARRLETDFLGEHAINFVGPNLQLF